MKRSEVKKWSACTCKEVFGTVLSHDFLPLILKRDSTREYILNVSQPVYQNLQTSFDQS